MVLGFFSFSKFLMYRDLDVNIWPDSSKPTEHPIIGALLHEGFDELAPTISSDDHLDQHLMVKDVNHVVDADGSQTLALVDVNNGRNLVVQGPPGTGKSQTITNMIAEAIGQGRTALFVSEKMAALEVVKRRLDNVGLGDAPGAPQPQDHQESGAGRTTTYPGVGPTPVGANRDRPGHPGPIAGPAERLLRGSQQPGGGERGQPI